MPQDHQGPPHLFTIGCTCHSIHLCSSAAYKKIAEEVEALARNIYVFFAHSSKRQCEFKEFQEYFNVKTHKILKTSSTRWLSLESDVTRISEQWNPLKHYFISFQLESNADLAQNIYNQMTDENNIYFLFLSYILKSTNKINIEYQNEGVKISLLLPTVKMYFKTILTNFVKADFIDDDKIDEIDFSNENCFFNFENIYIGGQANVFIINSCISMTKIKKIKEVCKLYYIKLCKQIQKRIHFSDDVLSSVSLGSKTKISNLGAFDKFFS